MGVLAGQLAAAIVFYLVPWAPIWGATLLVLAYLTWRRLDLALVLPVFFAPYFMLPKHIGHEQFAPAEMFIVLDVVVAAFWLADPAKRSSLRWFRLWRSPFLVPVALFFLAATISTVAAVDHHQALQAYRERIVEPLAWLALATLVLDRRRWLLPFAALLGAGLTVSVIGLWQRVTGRGLTTDALPKITSVYGSPDNLGLLLDRVLPVWLAATLLLLFRGLARRVWWVVGLILALALILSFSRGAWIAVVLAVVLQVALVTRRWRGRNLRVRYWLGAAAIIIILAAGLLATPAGRRLATAGHAGTASFRVAVWGAALHMVRDHPLLGVGPDNFLHYYAPAHDPYSGCAPGLNYLQPGSAGQPCLSHPHDEILDFWLSTGLLGLIAFLWLEVVFWRRWAALWRRREERYDRVVLLAVAGIMAASLIHGLVDNSYFLPDLALLFWLPFGALSELGFSSP